MNLRNYPWGKSAGVLAAAALAFAMGAPAALAQGTRWSERTILQFDRPVMIPGKVLQPGTYIFELANTQGDRDIMQVYTADPEHPDHERNLVATTVTVPTKREQANGDVVLKFANTEGAEPIALKAFFYPGSLRGHQFVYSQNEATQIARATHTLVLSHDIGNDMQQGTLYTIDANGHRAAWQQDPDVARDWAAWVSTRQQPTQHARSRWMHDNDAVGTSGRTAGRSTMSNMTSEQHAGAITRIVDQALHASGKRVTIDRSTLEQIRSHAEAIQNGGGSR